MVFPARQVATFAPPWAHHAALKGLPCTLARLQPAGHKPTGRFRDVVSRSPGLLHFIASERGPDVAARGERSPAGSIPFENGPGPIRESGQKRCHGGFVSCRVWSIWLTMLLEDRSSSNILYNILQLHGHVPVDAR